MKPARTPARARRAPLLLPGLLMLAAACGGPGDAPGETDGLSGAPALSLTRLAESPDTLDLTTVTGLDVDSRGQVYVADFPSLRIIVLSPGGEPVRTLGRRGDGPGEYQFIQGLQLLPGDSLLVYDQGHNRVTVLPPALDTVAYTVSLAAASPLSAPYQLRRLAGEGGYLAAYRRPFTTSGNTRNDREGKEVLRLLHPDGRVRRDSVLVVPAEETLVVRGPGMVSVGSNPFGRRSVFGVDREGRLYHGWTDSATVSVYALTGRRVGTIRVPQPPEPVTDAQVDRLAAEMGETFQRAFRESAPETWPAFHRLLPDDRGGVWLETGGGQRKLVHVGPDGSVGGVAALPPGFEPRAVRGGRLYGVSRDADRVPRVLIFQIGEGKA